MEKQILISYEEYLQLENCKKILEDIREETGYAKWVDSNTKRISSVATTIISKRQYAQEILEILKN